MIAQNCIDALKKLLQLDKLGVPARSTVSWMSALKEARAAIAQAESGPGRYVGFGGQADISVAGVQNLVDEIDFLEKQRNAYRAELIAERAESKELMEIMMDYFPGVTCWAGVSQAIEALQARQEAPLPLLRAA